MTTREQRVEVLTARDRNTARLRQERAAQFSTAMLLMPLRAMLPDHEDTYRTGALTVDQTDLPAFSARGLRTKDKKTKIELGKYRKDGTEIPRWVLEMDAGWAPKKSTLTGKALAESATNQADMEFVFALTTIAANPHLGLPKMMLGTSLNGPNREIAEETLRPIRALVTSGFTPAHLTGDKGYVQLGAVNYQAELAKIGVLPLFDYKVGQLGTQGGVGGSLQVEGDHYCPATPAPLLDATVDHRANRIDEDTRRVRIAERGKHRLRRKERPDQRGHYPMMCPAYGPQATVECPLRDVHPRSSTKAKPVITAENLPLAPDHVCTQTSVDFGPEDGIEHRQALRYGTPEWETTYRNDRQVVESLNDELSNGPEKLVDPHVRRVRGLAAQAFITLTGLVQLNIRRIATYLHEQTRLVPKPRYPRRRDTQHLSEYVRRDRSADAGAVLRLPDPPPRV